MAGATGVAGAWERSPSGVACGSSHCDVDRNEAER